jgi:hypothetical protein
LPAVTFDAPRSAAFALVLVIVSCCPFGEAELKATTELDTVIRAAVMAT